jgi:hypothetical protein
MLITKGLDYLTSDQGTGTNREDLCSSPLLNSLGQSFCSPGERDRMEEQSSVVSSNIPLFPQHPQPFSHHQAHI